MTAERPTRDWTDPETAHTWRIEQGVELERSVNEQPAAPWFGVTFRNLDTGERRTGILHAPLEDASDEALGFALRTSTPE